MLYAVVLAAVLNIVDKQQHLYCYCCTLITELTPHDPDLWTLTLEVAMWILYTQFQLPMTVSS